MEEVFTCPKCHAVYERNGHYKAILQNQNMINVMMGNKEFVDMCSKCNSFFAMKDSDFE
ncbi:hypothetical protein [Paenibacillus tianjinensis]|uniref:Uncharacterized protein n=1 Tax=Paenibacillus tianjinensis TaxID=2810347 RepID=A0ABX7L635_9BACL|nr:hypothetical protein [Paenibacillus tianjinensis]QSF43419.1 hypothetical protein JRJ22_19335 [Paenibacillus tianjinensis]